MRVLVYGAGVIGCYLTHVLCEAGNDVTLLARGAWSDCLEQNGLTIVHHLQKKTTCDYPKIVRRPEGTYDLAFGVMQYQQMGNILNDLANIDSPLVVLVGNNMAAAEMEHTIKENTPTAKTVLFGFQGTGGRRENGKVVCVRFGEGSMSLGCTADEPSEHIKKTIISVFQGTKYRLTWVPSMDAWYKCHLAFILPVCFLSYGLECDLAKASGRQIKQMLSAAREGYGLLSALGYPILPENTMEKLKGIRGGGSYFVMRLMAKTAIGRLAATDHCRHAVTEMEALDRGFAALQAQKPEFPMPDWDALHSSMPDWGTLRNLYRSTGQ